MCSCNFVGGFNCIRLVRWSDASAEIDRVGNCKISLLRSWLCQSDWDTKSRFENLLQQKGFPSIRTIWNSNSNTNIFSILVITLTIELSFSTNFSKGNTYIEELERTQNLRGKTLSYLFLLPLTFANFYERRIKPSRLLLPFDFWCWLELGNHWSNPTTSKETCRLQLEAQLPIQRLVRRKICEISC